MDDVENISDRFEDLDDMFDSILSELGHCVHRWLIFAKVTIEDDDDGFTMKGIFMQMAEDELEERYPKTFPMIENTEQGTILRGVVFPPELPG